MKRSIAVLLFVFMASWSNAQPSPEAFATAQKIAELQMKEAQPEFEEANQKIMQKIEAEADPTKRKMLQEIFRDGVLDAEDKRQMTQEIANSLAEKMTQQELNEILTFLQSPANKKLVEFSNELKSRLMGFVFQSLGRKMANVGAKLN